MLAALFRRCLIVLAMLFVAAPARATMETRVGAFELSCAYCTYGRAPVRLEGVGGKREAEPRTRGRPISRGYEAFGTKNAEAGTDPLAYGFAGEAFEGTSKLAYHRARWMDARAGRFLGIDPFQGPRILHRGYTHNYIYANNTPLDGVDPSGLDYDIGSVGAAAPAVGVLGTNAEQIVHVAETASEVAVAEGEALVQSSEVLVEEAGAAAAETEAVLAPGARSLLQSIWNLNPFQRGRIIEQGIGSGDLLDARLGVNNFPKIDMFVNNVATSIKSINLNAASYQNVGNAVSRAQGYVTSLSQYQGTGPNGFAGLVIKPENIVARQLILAIPRAIPPQVYSTISELVAFGLRQNPPVTVTITQIE